MPDHLRSWPADDVGVVVQEPLIEGARAAAHDTGVVVSLACDLLWQIIAGRGPNVESANEVGVPVSGQELLNSLGQRVGAEVKEKSIAVGAYSILVHGGHVSQTGPRGVLVVLLVIKWCEEELRRSGPDIGPPDRLDGTGSQLAVLGVARSPNISVTYGSESVE